MEALEIALTLFLRSPTPNLKRMDDESIQIRDDAGTLLLYKETGKTGETSERVATVDDFIKMLGDGTLAKSKHYVFRELPMLQYTLEAHNKSSGPLLPGESGYNGLKPLSEMSQAELGSVAFK